MWAFLRQNRGSKFSCQIRLKKKLCGGPSIKLQCWISQIILVFLEICLLLPCTLSAYGDIPDYFGSHQENETWYRRRLSEVWNSCNKKLHLINKHINTYANCWPSCGFNSTCHLGLICIFRIISESEAVESFSSALEPRARRLSGRWFSVHY